MPSTDLNDLQVSSGNLLGFSYPLREVRLTSTPFQGSAGARPSFFPKAEGAGFLST
ncbi:MAG: hypothetical protein N3E49_05910 [Bacteroidia bacterium]|nr:hypothetical protein [Bacteroidia bacterium]